MGKFSQEKFEETAVSFSFQVKIIKTYYHSKKLSNPFIEKLFVFVKVF